MWTLLAHTITDAARSDQRYGIQSILSLCKQWLQGVPQERQGILTVMWSLHHYVTPSKGAQCSIHSSLHAPYSLTWLPSRSDCMLTLLPEPFELLSGLLPPDLYRHPGLPCPQVQNPEVILFKLPKVGDWQRSCDNISQLFKYHRLSSTGHSAEAEYPTQVQSWLGVYHSHSDSWVLEP